MEFEQQVEKVEARIRKACDRSGRPRTDVRVVAVTKYVSVERAKQALQHGYSHLGENRWPDAREKLEEISDAATWHFIGHLQTKKAKHVVGKFQYIHSLDRLSLAEEIEKRAKALDLTVPCFVQFNVSGEPSKYGLPPEDADTFVEQMNSLPHIRIIGLMAMAPHEEDAQRTRPVFAQLRQLRDQLNQKQIYHTRFHELSMGMSNDFEVAIEEGATIIRLGSVLVGNDG